jgi:hypothetical protein
MPFDQLTKGGLIAGTNPHQLRVVGSSHGEALVAAKCHLSNELRLYRRKPDARRIIWRPCLQCHCTNEIPPWTRHIPFASLYFGWFAYPRNSEHC